MYNNDLNIPNISLGRILDFFLNDVTVNVHMTDLYGNIIGDRFMKDKNEWLKFTLRSIYEPSPRELANLLDMPVCKVDAIDRDYVRIEVLADDE